MPHKFRLSAPKACDVSVSYAAFKPIKRSCTMSKHVTFDKPTAASFKGSFMLPANTLLTMMLA